MPTLSFHVPQKLERQIRQAAKRQAVENELERQSKSFGEWARRVAGMVKGEDPGLSMKEGFDD
jgi:hypothetical protein